MAAYYNEFDPYAAAWLRNLILVGAIADGEVDTRSIKDVHPDDLRGFAQCHFFAGIGVWSHALRSAGWDDDRPVWTGSCPCQPFSAAGKGEGVNDERHLWPAWFRLIDVRRPVVVLGEQVAAKPALAWLDLVHADLEGAGYAVGAVDTCAAGVGAPHIRQRLCWMADAGSKGLPIRERDGRVQQEKMGPPAREAVVGGGDASGVEDPELPARARLGQYGGARLRQQEAERLAGSSGVSGWWGNAEWIECSDSLYRPVEPGTFPLAHGAPARVGRLRAYGNALVAPQAEEFIRAVMECMP